MKVSKMIAAVACFILLGVLTACAGCSQGGSASGSSAAANASAGSEGASAEASQKTEAEGPYASGVHHAILNVEGYDLITIELDADAAPASVANFCALANDGYYDGLTFYRFVDKFCMQGGTQGNSASSHDSSLEPVIGEFSGNGYDNPLADNFEKGVVAMARTQDPNSATSTFFITLDTSEGVSMSLNGQYAAFGTIDEAGMAIVDQIVADHLPFVTDAGLGAIGDEANQAKIASISIQD